MKIKHKLLFLLILISTILNSSCCHFLDVKQHKVQIKQVNGIGIKTIKSWDNEWDVLPFVIGDTIDEFIFCRGCISSINGINKNFIVIKIEQ